MSSKQALPSQGHDDIESYLEELRGFGEEILRKFNMGRADDIDAEFIQELLNTLKSSQKLASNSERRLHTLLQDIEDQCYAAKTQYNRTPELKAYYTQLRTLGYALRNVKS